MRLLEGKHRPSSLAWQVAVKMAEDQAKVYEVLTTLCCGLILGYSHCSYWFMSIYVVKLLLGPRVQPDF